jgi:DNA-binding CsgD family transcriptional regulator
MRGRGRPRHDDILTPREWEVLDLLRQGLTNEQIASRLSVTHDTAKFHVSEILGKLGVQSRHEAARWAGRQRVLRTLGLPATLLRKLTSVPAWKLAGGAIIAAAAVGLGALAAGVFLTDPSAGPEEALAPTVTPTLESLTGDEALDMLVESLLQDNAASLAALFPGITAREGLLIGGPIGLYQVQDVSPDEWTSRLGSATRTLHAVVKDPREPFPWWDQTPLPEPRASVLDAPRDFDIVLVVEEDGSPGNPWRFSLVEGRVIDLVIDSGTGPDGEPSNVPLPRRLGYLTPSPDDEPGSFLVLPPEDQRPPPAGLGQGSGPGGAPEPPPAGADPTFAPDGRTGDPALDALIESLLNDDAATLVQRYGDLAARQQKCNPNCEDVRVSSSDWTQRLASAERTLYAAFTGDPADAQLMLAVEVSSPNAEAWRFSVLGGQLAELEIFMPDTDPPYDVYQRVSTYTPSPAEEYERFFVLPPRDQLPQPPPNHPLSVPSGEPSVDSLLAVLEARDVDGLLASMDTADGLLLRECRGPDSQQDAAFAQAWAEDTTAEAYGVHAVINLPEGYQPQADHLLILVTQQNPYKWESIGILEKQGAIVLITNECQADLLYPPARYVTPPPEGGLAGLAPGRRSGIPIIDAILDAAQAQDVTAMAGLIEYQTVACSEPGQIGSLPCPPGAAPGTPLDALPSSACEGGYVLPNDAPASLIETASAPLYAVVETQLSGVPAYEVVVATPEGGGVALAIGERGVTSVSRGCFAGSPDWLLQGYGQPSFLLPPP